MQIVKSCIYFIVITLDDLSRFGGDVAPIYWNNLTGGIFTLFKANIQRWQPAAATSFVVSFVLSSNRVNIVAVTTILVLHVRVIGHHVPRH